VAWSPEAAKSLAADPAFRDLFEDPASPVVREIDSLERIALDPSSDPAVAHDAACRRSGILKVLMSVQGTIDAEQLPAEQEAPRRPRSRYLGRLP